MIFRNPLDDLLPGRTGEILGRLLIDVQQLEEAIRCSLEVAFAAIDPVGIISMWSGDRKINFKLHIGQQVLDRAAERFGVPKVKFNGTVQATIFPSDTKDADERAAQAFAAMRHELSVAKNLIDYRNKLFHGHVEVEGSDVQFIGEPGQSFGDAMSFEVKRQEIRRAKFLLLMASNSIKLALAYLVQREAKPEQG